MKQPTQRTLEWLRRHGALCAVVERWNPHVGEHGIRQDMHGFVDVLAEWPHCTHYIQVTTTGGVVDRINKILQTVEIKAKADRILANWPNRRIFVIGWRKRQLKGKRPEWVRRIVEIQPGCLPPEANSGAYVELEGDEYIAGAVNGQKIHHRQATRQHQEQERPTGNAWG